MRTFSKTFLPDSIEVNGITLKMNPEISGAMNANGTHPNKIAKELRKQGRQCAMVMVLDKTLKGRTDLHGKLYQPTKWIFTN